MGQETPAFGPFPLLGHQFNWFSLIEQKSFQTNKIKTIFSALLVAEISRFMDWQHFVIICDKKLNRSKSIKKLMLFLQFEKKIYFGNYLMTIPSCFHCSFVMNWNKFTFYSQYPSSFFFGGGEGDQTGSTVLMYDSDALIHVSVLILTLSCLAALY